MTVDLAKIDYGESGWERKANKNFSDINSDTFHLMGGPVSRLNLILNSATPRNTEHWSTPVGGKVIVSRNGFYKNGKVNLFALIHDKDNPGVHDEVYALSDEYVLAPNTDYDVFFIAFGAVGITSFDCYMICHDSDGNINNINLASEYIPNPGKTVLYQFTFNSGSNVSGRFRIDNNGSTDGVVHNLYFTEVFVGKSEYWAPAAGDISKFSSMEWIKPALLAPFDGTFEYKISETGLIFRGYFFPRTYSNHTSIQVTQIPINGINDFGSNKAVIVEQDNGHYATLSVASDGKIWLVSAEGAAGDAIHLDNVSIA